jgi:hypothetical protein
LQYCNSNQPSHSIALDTFYEDNNLSWKKIIQDEGFMRAIGLAVVDHTSLARLIPGKWLNCELIQVYAFFCKEAGDVRILSTCVWRYVSSGNVRDATKNLGVKPVIFIDQRGAKRQR